MTGDDFYVDDETPDEVRAAIKRGEKGETVGKKNLNRRARSIVDRAVERLDGIDGQQAPCTGIRKEVVSGNSDT